MMPTSDKNRADARRVLIVEDEAVVRRSLLLLLKGRGFDAVAYASAAQAMADAAAHPPACLVTDFCLEEGDGIALLEALRAGGWRGPAILISAFSSTVLAERARSAGFAITFEKPLRAYALVDAVKRLTLDDAERYIAPS